MNYDFSDVYKKLMDSYVIEDSKPKPNLTPEKIAQIESVIGKKLVNKSCMELFREKISASNAEIDEIENLLGRSLAKEHLDLFTKLNGAPLISADLVSAHELIDFLKHHRDYRHAKNHGYVPIASDGCGHYYVACYSLNSDNPPNLLS